MAARFPIRGEREREREKVRRKERKDDGCALNVAVLAWTLCVVVGKEGYMDGCRGDGEGLVLQCVALSIIALSRGESNKGMTDAIRFAHEIRSSDLQIFWPSRIQFPELSPDQKTIFTFNFR